MELTKLKQAKVDGACLNLFTSYLENRKQRTVVDNVKSKFKNVTTGVIATILLKILNLRYCYLLTIPAALCLALTQQKLQLFLTVVGL